MEAGLRLDHRRDHTELPGLQTQQEREVEGEADVCAPGQHTVDRIDAEREGLDHGSDSHLLEDSQLVGDVHGRAKDKGVDPKTDGQGRLGVDRRSGTQRNNKQDGHQQNQVPA